MLEKANIYCPAIDAGTVEHFWISIKEMYYFLHTEWIIFYTILSLLSQIYTEGASTINICTK